MDRKVQQEECERMHAYRANQQQRPRSSIHFATQEADEKKRT